MSDNRKNNGDNLSHEDRVKGGQHSHDNQSDRNTDKDNKNNNNKSGHEFTDEERSRGGKNS